MWCAKLRNLRIRTALWVLAVPLSVLISHEKAGRVACQTATMAGSWFRDDHYPGARCRNGDGDDGRCRVSG